MTSDSSAADAVAIDRAARDYYEAWFNGDPDRMAACLHPRLVKRAVEDPALADSPLAENSWSSMVEGAREGRGTAHRGAPIEVSVLDVFRNVATAKVAAGPYVEYIHLARFGSSWRIVNVLWEPRLRAPDELPPGGV